MEEISKGMRMNLFQPLAMIALAVFAISDSVWAQDRKINVVPKSQDAKPICDSQGFLEFAKQVEEARQKRLLSEAEFAKAMQEANTIVLDARSDGSYDQLRIKGSKNLPYTSFSEKTLHELIPDRSTRILIYSATTCWMPPRTARRTNIERRAMSGEN